MTITYRTDTPEVEADIVLCDGPDCEASHLPPLQHPWRLVITFSPDGALAAQRDYCSSACLAADLLLQTAA